MGLVGKNLMVRPYRDVLAIRDARALIGASAASEIGNWLYNAALRRYHELPQWRSIWRQIEITGVPEGMFSTDQ